MFIYFENEKSFNSLSYETYFIILFGVFAFSLGSELALFAFPNHGKHNIRRIEQKNILVGLIFWLPIIGLPFFVANAYFLAANGPSDILLINLRRSLTGEDGSPDKFGWWVYLISIANFSIGLNFINQVNWRRQIISISAAITYDIFATGRTFLVFTMVFILALQLILKRPNFKRNILLWSIPFIVSFFILGATLGKGGILDQGLKENIDSIVPIFRTYVVGPVPAFDQYLRNKPEVDFGKNTFRFFLAVLSKIGIDIKVPQLMQPFVFVPDPVNVYTLYQTYFMDYSFIGVYLIQFFLGFFHGFLYVKSKSGHPFYIFIFSIFLYPLFMQFFEDQYVSLLSTWLQYLLLALIFFPLGRKIIYPQSFIGKYE